MMMSQFIDAFCSAKYHNNFSLNFYEKFSEIDNGGKLHDE